MGILLLHLHTCIQEFRDEVDSFMAGKRIPHCHLKAKFSGDLTAIPDLECDIDVLGSHNRSVIYFAPSVEVSDCYSALTCSKGQ